MRRYGATTVLQGGLKVYTTLDEDFQASAEKALETQLEAVEKRNASVYRYLRDPSSRVGSLPDSAKSTPYVQGALVAVEPQTGAIRALVGGRDFSESKFNRATQAERQPGSAFKPFIYAAALRSGMKTNDTVLDAPVSFTFGGPGERKQVWEPKNFSRTYSGPVTLRWALMKSINVPSIRLLEKVGAKQVIQLAHAMGITSDLPSTLSLALGTGETTPLEMASAYASLGNEGIWKEPYVIEKVEDRYGRVLEAHQPKSREGLEEKVSYQTLSLMRSVFDGGTAWTARSAYGFTAPAAGKTGTTDDYSDAWFVGLVPRLSCAVWVGFDEKRPIGNRMTGAAAALPAWCAFMNHVVERYGPEDFVPPPGIVEVETCAQSGKLATPNCRRTAKDAFITGTEPTTYCPIHRNAEPAVEAPDDGDE